MAEAVGWRGDLSFCARSSVLDDPGARPGGQLRAEWAKVMSSCGKMINLSLSVLYSMRRQDAQQNETNKWLIGPYVNFIFITLGCCLIASSL